MNELYLFFDKTTARVMAWTPLSDGSNLPGSHDWRLRVTQSIPTEPFRQGPELKRILKAISADGFMMLGPT
jgi:hypothetical protein